MQLNIDYVEFYGADVEETVTFFQDALGWQAQFYGPDYVDFSEAGVGVGMERTTRKAPLIVLKCEDLEATLAKLKAAGAEITAEIFAFPGGRRFHFKEPSGTEMAAWCEAEVDATIKTPQA